MMRNFFRDESGATAIEYGLIGAGIFLVIVSAVALIGPRLQAIFEQAAAGMVLS